MEQLVQGIELLALNKEADKLATEYVKRCVIPEKYSANANHVAIAVTNGIRYHISWNFKHIVKKVWELLFEMAHKLYIQIFATTYSWDCIESFANTAIARKDVEEVLFRVGRSVRESDQGQVIAAVFDEEVR